MGDFDNRMMYFKNRAANIFQKKEEAIKKIVWDPDADETEVLKEESKEISDREFIEKINESLKKKPRSANTRSNRTKRNQGPRKSSKNGWQESIANLPRAAQKRLRDVQLKIEKEKESMEMDLHVALEGFSHMEDEAELPKLLPASEQRIKLMVQHMTRLHKVEVGENEKFSSIFFKIADTCNLEASEIMLCRGEDNIRLGDTPLSLKIKSYEILECYPLKLPLEKSADKLLLKFQSNDFRRRIELYIHRLDKLQKVMDEYSQQRNIALHNLVFEFDGEQIDGSETPVDLDMESGSCIDVKVLNLPPRPSKPILVDLDSEVVDHKLMDVCVLD